MLVYKAFAPGLVCRGYQFHKGENVTEAANCVQNGFHAAENPIDCLTYYPDVRRSEYWIVEASGDIHEDGTDSKLACTHLTPIRRLSLNDYFLHCLLYLARHPHDRRRMAHVSKDAAQAAHGYVIVYGASPIAKGKTGDILALLQVDADGNAIALGVYPIDGKKYKADTYIDVLGKEREYV